MIIAVLFIVSALVLYTTAIWSERISRRLKRWMVVVFSSGFICDLAGTSMMFLRAEHKFALSTHVISGYSALLIMLLHLSWAFLAIRKQGRYESYFTRFSLFAWMLWLTAFLSGMPRANF